MTKYSDRNVEAKKAVGLLNSLTEGVLYGYHNQCLGLTMTLVSISLHSKLQLKLLQCEYGVNTNWCAYHRCHFCQWLRLALLSYVKQPPTWWQWSSHPWQTRISEDSGLCTMDLEGCDWDNRCCSEASLASIEAWNAMVYAKPCWEAILQSTVLWISYCMRSAINCSMLRPQSAWVFFFLSLIVMWLILILTWFKVP